MQKLWGLVAVPLLAGCSLLAGGSGDFTVEGENYELDQITCLSQSGTLHISMRSGAATAAMQLSDSATPVVEKVQMGAGQQVSMAMDAGAEVGRATVRRTEQTFDVEGLLARVSESGQPLAEADEPFTLSVTCREIKTVP